MRKGLYTIQFLLLSASYIFAQQQCGYNTLLQNIQQQYPAYYDAVQEFYEEAQQATTYRNDEVYTIPIVVHVVWQRPEENISDAQIHEQLDVINKAFRRRIHDMDKVRGIFRGVVGDPRIEFQLDKIIRVQTDTPFKTQIDINNLQILYPDNVKLTSLGGSDAWDTEQYLNIWVCKIEDDKLLGYSYPPAMMDNWPEHSQSFPKEYDGIVLNYKAFGQHLDPFVNAAGDIIKLEGKALVHEIGHYLGLRHTWGDSELFVNDCALDDGLEDTPPMYGPSSSCDYEKNTCINNEGYDFPDMIENYMDYTVDECRISFTKQQIALMRYVLANRRPYLRASKLANNPSEDIIIYPNPTAKYCFIYTQPFQNPIYKIRVRSISGIPVNITISDVVGDNSNYKLDCSTLANGTYVVECFTLNEQFTKLVVVAK